jgi:hypothetical protein
LQPKKNYHSNSYHQDASKNKADSIPLNFDQLNKKNFENRENYSLISNSGNKDISEYVSNREAVKPRKIFG